MASKHSSRWDQRFPTHKVSGSNSPNVQKIKDDQVAQLCLSQRSSSYSPPPVAIPAAPKAMVYPPLTSETRSLATLGLIKPSEGRYISDPSTTHFSSPELAPWNEHRMKSQDPQCHKMYSDEEERANESPGRRWVRAVETCDNYGCDGFHHHDDCPLEKRCWGCRSPNHFWTDCPVRYILCLQSFPNLISFRVVDKISAATISTSIFCARTLPLRRDADCKSLR